MRRVPRSPLLGLAGLALALVCQAGPARAQAPPARTPAPTRAASASTPRAVSDAAAARPRRVPPRPSCEGCHGELELLRQHGPDIARARELLAPAATLAASAHGEMTCAECHSGFTAFPHDARPTATRACASCHPAPDTAFHAGAHARTRPGDEVDCTSCHGTHDVLPVAALKTAEGTARMNRECVACHAQGARFKPGTPHADSVSCAGCHGAHDIRLADAPGSRLHRKAQAETCGACHQKIARVWVRDDIHAEALTKKHTKPGGPERAPACTDCHGAHDMPAADSTRVRAGSERCAECHEHYDDAYADSYHGKASHLGGEKAAACADCHLAHAIRPASDPRSSVSEARLTETCRRCHPTANAAFTKFDAHVDPHDSDNPIIYWTYKAMTLLLLGTLSFFGLHTLLWLIRLRLDGRRAAIGRGE